jgi:DNA-binding PadR family transcriptional regulator
MEAQENLPLTESTFYILLSLAPGPKHGYAIMKDVKILSENRVVLSTGTLYGAIKRLLDQGWILRVDEPAEDGNGRERKAYLLTHRGRRILEAETARLGKLYRAAQLRVIGEEA